MYDEMEQDGGMGIGGGAALGAGLGLGAAGLMAIPQARQGLRSAAKWAMQGDPGGMRRGMAPSFDMAAGVGDDIAGGLGAGMERLKGGIQRQLGTAGDIAPGQGARDATSMLREATQRDPKIAAILSDPMQAKALKDTAKGIVAGDEMAMKTAQQMPAEYQSVLSLMVKQETEAAQIGRGLGMAGMAGGAGAVAGGAGAAMFGGE